MLTLLIAAGAVLALTQFVIAAGAFVTLVSSTARINPAASVEAH